MLIEYHAHQVSCSSSIMLIEYHAHRVSCSSSIMLVFKYHARHQVSCSSSSIMLVFKYHASLQVSCSSSSIMLIFKYHARLQVSCSSSSIMLVFKYLVIKCHYTVYYSTYFLDASSHLDKRLCISIPLSVCPYILPSIHLSVCPPVVCHNRTLTRLDFSNVDEIPYLLSTT